MAASTEPTWSMESEGILIEMWSERPCLYAISSPEYSDRDKKEAALTDIASSVGKTVSEVKKKLSGLRNSFNRAKRIPNSGSQAKQLTKRAEWLLKSLSFLNAHTGHRPSTSNLEGDDNDDNGDSGDEDNSILDESHISSNKGDDDVVLTKSTKRPLTPNMQKKSSKRKREEEEMDILKILAKSLGDDSEKRNDDHPLSQNDQCSSFGVHVANSLHPLDVLHRAVAMDELQRSLTRASVDQIQRSQQSNLYATSCQYQPMTPQQTSQTYPDTADQNAYGQDGYTIQNL